MKHMKPIALACAFAVAGALACAGLAVCADVQPALAKAKKQTVQIGASGLSRISYTAKKVPLDAKAKTKLSYKSSNKEVVTVNKKGKLTLKKAGSAKITVTAKGTGKYKAAKRTVKVKVVRAKQTISAESFEKTFKQSFKIRAKAKGGATLAYKTSNEGIAKVNAKTGKVTCGSTVGVATITVTAAKTPRYREATKKVTVRVTRYPYLFALSKSKGTFSLARLLSGLSLQRKPVALDGLRTCDELTPQGMCVDGGRVYMTAYCKFHGSGAGTVKHNSILYIADKAGMRPIKALVLPETASNHVGGVTVDADGNVWVAGSTAKNALLLRKATVDAAIADTSSDTVEVRRYDAKVPVDVGSSVSFIEYADGLVWIGDYYTSKLHTYAIEKTDGEASGLSPRGSYSVASGANGVSVFNRGGKRYLALSRQVSGRHGYSEVLVYEDAGGKAKLVGGAGMPCMLEEIDFDADMTMYAVYESAAKTYRTGSDGNGTPNEVVGYGTIGDGSALIAKALAAGAR